MYTGWLFSVLLCVLVTETGCVIECCVVRQRFPSSFDVWIGGQNMYIVCC